MSSPLDGLDRLGARAQRPANRLRIDADVLAKLEAAIHGQVEPAYRDFLLEHGGLGFDALVRFELPAGCPWGRSGILTELFGRFDGPGDLLTELAHSELGAGWLPIGRDPGGNLLVLRTQHVGGIWFWDHEARPAAADVTSGDVVVTSSGERLYRVAESFSAFLAGLDGRSWEDDGPWTTEGGQADREPGNCS